MLKWLLSSNSLSVYQAVGVCVVEHNVTVTAKNADGWVLVQNSALHGIPDSHVVSGSINCKDRTVGTWDTAPFQNLFPFCSIWLLPCCSCCPCQAHVEKWFSHTLCSPHISSLWIIQLDLCDYPNVSNGSRLICPRLYFTIFILPHYTCTFYILSNYN